MANGGVSFGESLIFSSLKKVDYALSDDKKAFEIRFDTGLAAGVGTPVFEGLAKTRAPVSTRVYSAVIPATGEDVEVSLNVNGFGVTEAGTNTADGERPAHRHPFRRREGRGFCGGAAVSSQSGYRDQADRRSHRRAGFPSSRCLGPDRRHRYRG